MAAISGKKESPKKGVWINDPEKREKKGKKELLYAMGVNLYSPQISMGIEPETDVEYSKPTSNCPIVSACHFACREARM